MALNEDLKDLSEVQARRIVVVSDIERKLIDLDILNTDTL